MATPSERMFALPLNTLAGDSDFTYTALSNDAANNRTGQSIHTSFESRLPGYLNFGNDSSKKRGREDGDEQSLESEWRVALHKILINNYPENSPVMKVFRDDNSLVHCEQLPLGYYPNWNSVLRQTYDLLQNNFERMQVPVCSISFLEQYLFDYTHSNSTIVQKAFLRHFDGVKKRTLDNHQEYILNLYTADATVEDVLKALLATMSDGTRVYEFNSKNFTLRNKHEAVEVMDTNHKSGYGYFYSRNQYELRPYNWSHITDSCFFFSEAMAVMLGLHESNNYYLLNNTSVTRQSDGIYAVKFPLFTSRLTWVSSSLNKKYAAVLKNVQIKRTAALSLEIDLAQKAVCLKTINNMRVVLENKKGLLLTELRDGEKIFFSEFFADNLYRDYLQSEAVRVNLPSLQFLNRMQGTSQNLSSLLHPLIPLPMEERVVAFYPHAERHPRKLAKKQQVQTLEINLRDSWQSQKEPIFYTGANVLVLTFFKQGLDWY